MKVKKINLLNLSLKKQIKNLAKNNMVLKSGVECEYFLINSEGTSIADSRDTQPKPCYDQSALMRQYDLKKTWRSAVLRLSV